MISALISAAFSGLWSALQRAFKWLGTLDSRTIGMMLLALSTGYFAWGKSRAQRETAKCEARHAAFVADVKEASAKADAAAKQIVLETERKNDAIRQLSDEAYASRREAAMARARSFTDAHRVRKDGAGRAASAVVPEAAIATEGSDGPDSDAVLVEVSDVETCTENTTRLQEIQDWAKRIAAAQ